MKKIMFVCHGNICRSPMAEMILREIIHRNHREKEFSVSSTAVSREEWGNPMYPPAVSAMGKAGYPVDKTKRAVTFTARDYEEYDHIYCMDRSNLRRLLTVTDGDPQGKIQLLLEAVGMGQEVDDPYYCGGFDGVCRQIEAACKALSEDLKILIAQ